MDPILNVVDVNVVLGVLVLGVVRSVSVGGLVVFRGLLLLTVVFLFLQKGKIGEIVGLVLVGVKKYIEKNEEGQNHSHSIRLKMECYAHDHTWSVDILALSSNSSSTSSSSSSDVSSSASFSHLMNGSAFLWICSDNSLDTYFLLTLKILGNE